LPRCRGKLDAMRCNCPSVISTHPQYHKKSI
jgi:hypothetical protein